MVLHFVSLGLGDAKDITVRGLEIVKNCERIYLECYTAILSIQAQELEAFYGKPVIIADRHMVERDAADIMKDADTIDVAFLVVGDAFAATTHHDIYLRAVAQKIPVNVIHNASIMNAVACCGLQLYQFGLTVSICFFDGTWRPYSYFNKFVVNFNNGMHTLCLLDIKVKEQTPDNIVKGIEKYEPARYMTVNQAIEQIFETEDNLKTGLITRDSWAIGMARVGQPDQCIVAGPMNKLIDVDFGAPLHSLVLPGPELHPIELSMIFHYWYDQDKKDEELEKYQTMQEQKRMKEIQDRIDARRREQEELRAEAARQRAAAEAEESSSDDDSDGSDADDSQ